MNEEELMALVGRLYVGTVLRDNELKRLRKSIADVEASYPVVEVENDGDLEPQ